MYSWHCLVYEFLVTGVLHAYKLMLLFSRCHHVLPQPLDSTKRQGRLYHQMMRACLEMKQMAFQVRFLWVHWMHACLPVYDDICI